MKIIVTGASGLVGSEIIKRSLHMKEITSIIAVARQPITLDEGVNASKLKSVVVKDYENYPDNVKDEFSEADACIWTVAVTPGKAMSMDPAEVKHICDDCTVAGFKAMCDAVPAKPFRFFYFSGAPSMLDSLPKSFILGDYSIMRAEIARKVADFPKENEDVEVAIAYPGIITTNATWARTAMQAVYSATNLVGRRKILTNISGPQLAAAALHQVVHGFEKVKLSNDDLLRIGQEALDNESQGGNGGKTQV